MRPIATLAAAAAIVLCSGGDAAMAQEQRGDGAVRNRRPVRRPVIDLEKAAKQPRPGQVLLGEPAIGTPAPAAPLSAPAAAPPASATPAPAPPPAASTAAPAPVILPPAPPGDPGDPVTAIVAEVGGPASQVQWRRTDSPGDDGWSAIETGARSDGRLEVRTGLAGAVTLDIDGAVAVRLGRLTRARIERRIADGRPEIVIHLVRGRVVAEPRAVDQLGLGRVPVRIVTPAGTAVRRVAVEVAYDAMNGMRETVLNRE